MNADQTIVPVEVEALPGRVLMLRHEGWRLVHIGATPLPEIMEVNYGFDRQGEYVTLRVTLPAAAPKLPSISRIYWAAFIYENELHDLFNIEVEGMAVDFKGHFIKTAVPFAWAGQKAAPVQTAVVPGASMSVRPPAPEKTPPASPS